MADEADFTKDEWTLLLESPRKAARCFFIR